MAEESLGDGILLTRIIIERRIIDDGSYAVYSSIQTADGDDPALVETLGMLELTKDTAIRSCMGEVGE